MGSILDLVTSVDLGSVSDMQYWGPFNTLSDVLGKAVTAAIAVWPVGSSAVAGSLDGTLGAFGTALASLGGQ
ncbi:hypothetical protein RHDE110596_04490 [Prescottella defluvii]